MYRGLVDALKKELPDWFVEWSGQSCRVEIRKQILDEPMYIVTGEIAERTSGKSYPKFAANMREHIENDKSQGNQMFFGKIQVVDATKDDQ